MKTLSMLLAATALTGMSATAFAAQDEGRDQIIVKGDAVAPQPNEVVQDNDLFLTIANAWDNSDFDRAPWTDDHHWIGLRVESSEGGRIGEIERVRLSAEGEVEALVVEHGGFLDIGGHETLIDVSDVDFRRVGDDRPIAVLAYTRAEFEALPEFNEDAATEFPFSDRDYNDNEAELELDDDPSS